MIGYIKGQIKLEIRVRGARCPAQRRAGHRFDFAGLRMSDVGHRNAITLSSASFTADPDRTKKHRNTKIWSKVELINQSRLFLLTMAPL